MPSYLSSASRTPMRMARRSSLSTTGKAGRRDTAVRRISINGTSVKGRVAVCVCEVRLRLLSGVGGSILKKNLFSS